MTTPHDLAPSCAAPGCDLNLAGRPHAPADCDTPPPAPTLPAETVARLPEHRRPWVQGAARTFARLNPTLLPGAENRFRDPDRRAQVIAERAGMAALHAIDRDKLLANLDRLPPGTPDLSGRSVLDARFYAFLLSDHPAARVERCRRRAAYLDETAREREVLHGWLARLDATPPRSRERYDDTARRLAVTTRALLDRQAGRLAREVGEPDLARVSQARAAWEAERRAAGHRHPGYPSRYRGVAAARQPIPPEPPDPASAERSARTSRPGRASHRDRRQRRPGREAGHER